MTITDVAMPIGPDGASAVGLGDVVLGVVVCSALVALIFTIAWLVQQARKYATGKRVRRHRPRHVVHRGSATGCALAEL